MEADLSAGSRDYTTLPCLGEPCADGWLVSLAVMGYNDPHHVKEEVRTMAREIVSTDKAPAAVGPYSQAVRIGDLIYTAGQLGIVPGSGQFAGADVEAQTRQALENLKAILEAASSCLEHVVKTTVFMQDMGMFARMNAVYAEFFPEEPPARSAVEVAALPLGGQVEIEAVAEVCDCDSEEECGCCT
jgi:2-iminobutanoate/2-iminopropanoate deaminase